MKIRIKGPSVRIRLSRSEVAAIVHNGYLEESTPFIHTAFVYALQRVEEGNELTASFEHGKMTMFVPKSLIQEWDTNTLVTIDNHMPVSGKERIYLLLEKDFQCLDVVNEDQSDNYINPSKNC